MGNGLLSCWLWAEKQVRWKSRMAENISSIRPRCSSISAVFPFGLSSIFQKPLYHSPLPRLFGAFRFLLDAYIFLSFFLFHPLSRVVWLSGDRKGPRKLEDIRRKGLKTSDLFFGRPFPLPLALRSPRHQRKRRNQDDGAIVNSHQPQRLFIPVGLIQNVLLQLGGSNNWRVRVISQFATSAQFLLLSAKWRTLCRTMSPSIFPSDISTSLLLLAWYLLVDFLYLAPLEAFQHFGSCV